MEDIRLNKERMAQLEVEDTIQWIQRNGYVKVALQLPDDMLVSGIRMRMKENEGDRRWAQDNRNNL